MITNFYNVILSETYILKKSQIPRWALGIAVLLLSYLLKESTKLRFELSGSHYFTSQLLLGVIVIVVFFPIIIGGVVGSKDYEWATWGMKLTSVGRSRLLAVKMFVILAASVFVTSLALVLGLIFDFNASALSLSYLVFYQLIATIYIGFFWGTITFIVSVITKSLTFSIVITYSYVLLEPLFYTHLSEDIRLFLPIWNQRSFLYELFPSGGGVLIIPYFEYNHPWSGLAIFTLYLIITILAIFFVIRKKEFE